MSAESNNSPNTGASGGYYVSPNRTMPWHPLANPYIQPRPATNPFPPQQTVTQYVTTDRLLTKVRSIREMLDAKAITRAEARKMLAALDPAFAAILRSK